MIAVAPENPSHRQRAERIAADLQLTLMSSSEVLCQEGCLLVWVSDYGIGLKRSGRKGPNPVYVDFLQGAMGYRKQQRSLSRELIAKAVGRKPDVMTDVLDATAGFGRDSFILALLGCRVRMLERNPIVALLLKDGLERAKSDSDTAAVVERMQLLDMDAVLCMDRLEPEQSPDVVYLDPMFPEKRKSALVKKDMQLLQQLLQSDVESDNLLTKAIGAARQRVVVKRPRHAPALEQRRPDYQIEGKSNRFDVYLIP